MPHVDLVWHIDPFQLVTAVCMILLGADAWVHRRAQKERDLARNDVDMARELKRLKRIIRTASARSSGKMGALNKRLLEIEHKQTRHETALSIAGLFQHEQ